MTTITRARRIAGALAATMAPVLAVSACAASAAGGGGGDSKTVDIIAFSVPKPAYDALQGAFQKTDAGKGVKFSASYGPSGDQSKAVSSGQPANYVALSLQPDMDKLVPDHVDKDWNTGSNKGIVSSSVVVIVTRKGNPKHITGWDDLIKPGIGIVSPDPASSGSAKWNILAAYTHVLADGGTEAQAAAYLKAFYKNLAARPTSGSNATSTFSNGTGDVLISYENEAINARQKGEDFDYIVPKESFLIQNPGAVTKDAPQAAKDFLKFAISSDGQKIFASKGFRPIDSSVQPGTVQGANDPSNPFPKVQKLYTIDQLGGWDAVNKKFFDDKTGLVTKIGGDG